MLLMYKKIITFHYSKQNPDKKNFQSLKHYNTWVCLQVTVAGAISVFTRQQWKHSYLQLIAQILYKKLYHNDYL